MSESDIRIGSAIGVPLTESHERTNERTEKVLAAVNQETAVDARARSNDSTEVLLGEVIAAGSRSPVRMTGCLCPVGMNPIAAHVRAAVRDVGRGGHLAAEHLRAVRAELQTARDGLCSHGVKPDMCTDHADHARELMRAAKHDTEEGP